TNSSILSIHNCIQSTLENDYFKQKLTEFYKENKRLKEQITKLTSENNTLKVCNLVHSIKQDAYCQTNIINHCDKLINNSSLALSKPPIPSKCSVCTNTNNKKTKSVN